VWRRIRNSPIVWTPGSLTSKLQGMSFFLFVELSKYRCILIARSHTLLKDDISALALYERAQSYISKLPSSLPSITDDIPITKDDISSLIKTLESEMTRAHAQVILSNPTQIDSAQKVLQLTSLKLTSRNLCWRNYISSHDLRQLI
jgi:hypothetical protein